MRETFSYNSFYFIELRKITYSVTKITMFPHGGKSKMLPYLLDLSNLINLLEQKIFPDSNLRVKTMYESVKKDVLIGGLKKSKV